MAKPTVRVNLNLDPDLYDKVKARADKERRSLKSIVEKAVIDYLKTTKGGDK